MPTVPRSEVLASPLIVLLLAIRLPFVALGNRSTACLSLIAIGAVVLLLAGGQRPDFTGWLIASLACVSAITGTLAIWIRSDLIATISIGSILVLWAVDLTEQLSFRTSEPGSQELGPAARH